ncbi:MAG: DUF3592 domain-containing protein, partial [Planctomycetota bacterium]
MADPCDEDSTIQVLTGLFFGLAFCILCPFIAYQSYKGYRQTNASRDWSTTEMEVRSTEIIHQTANRRYARENFRPNIEYVYSVEGAEYVGRRIHFTQGLYP